jgi:hypothetical protein
MSRAPIAYSLGRPLEGEAGGAADLQTDIMRFMAILALCLMAIFALVQSLPDAPATAAIPDESNVPVEDVPAMSETGVAAPKPVTEPLSRLVTPRRPAKPPNAQEPKPVQLARLSDSQPDSTPAPPVTRTTSSPPTTEGFTLRFESDVALSRLVATGQVGFFALDDNGAQRMSVSGNDVSFWAAPMPASFHEMDAATVPAAVRRALSRTGRADRVRSWAVTLPSRLSGELERIMQAHKGGALVIARDGTLRRESS